MTSKPQSSAAKPNKGGRPPKKLTASQVDKVEALSSVLTVSQIADYFSMSENTFTAVRERQPEVSEAYKRGKAKAIKDIANSLLTKARDGDTASIIFYLKTQAGWRETQHIDHSSTDGSMAPSKIEIIALK